MFYTFIAVLILITTSQTLSAMTKEQGDLELIKCEYLVNRNYPALIDWYNKQMGTIGDFKHEYRIKSAQFDQTGTYILTIDDEKNVQIWDRAGKSYNTINHGYKANSAVFSAPVSVNTTQGTYTGNLILSTAESTRPGFTSIRSPDGTYFSTFESNTEVLNALISPDNTRIVIRTQDYKDNISILEVTDKYSFRLLGPQHTTYDNYSKILFLGTKKNYFIAIIERAKVRILNRDGISCHTLEHLNLVTSVDFNPVSKYFLTASNAGNVEVCVWNIIGTKLTTIEMGSSVKLARFTPNGSAILTATNKEVAVWNLDGKKIRRCQFHTEIKEAAFSPCEKYALVTTDALTNNTIELYNIDQEKKIFSYTYPPDHYDLIKSISFSPCGDYILVRFSHTLKVIPAPAYFMSMYGILPGEKPDAQFNEIAKSNYAVFTNYIN